MATGRPATPRPASRAPTTWCSSSTSWPASSKGCPYGPRVSGARTAGSSEGGQAVGGAQAGWGVVAGFRGAQVVVTAEVGWRAEQRVAAPGHVEQVPGVAVQVPRADPGRVPGQPVDPGDE